MTLENFYLVCFVVGFAFSAISFLLGTIHLPHWVHLPHLGIHHGVPHVHTEMHLPHAHGHGPVAHGAPISPNDFHISPLNFSMFMAFLAWFGGAGYLLTHYSTLVGSVALLASIGAGVVGGGIVFVFMAKVLMSADENLDPADYDMVGVLGRLSVGIRIGGTGEIVYSQGGTRKSAAARAEDGLAIDKGSEVVVTRYGRGIAYVRRWEDMTGEPRPEELETGGPH